MAFRFFAKAADPVLSASQGERLQAWQQLPVPSLNQPHYQVRYVVLYLATGGLDPEQHPITSLAAVGVSQGRIRPQDAFWMEPGSTDPEAWLGLLEFVGKAPLVGFQLPLLRAFLEPALEANLGLEDDFAWLDLAVLLPELFRGASEEGRGLEGWQEYFSLAPEARGDVMGNALSQARLLQRLLSAARSRGADTPAALLEQAKARRWLHGES